MLKNGEVKRLPSQAREAFQIFCACQGMLGSLESYFEPIMRRVPNGWRDFRLAKSRIDRLAVDIIGTLPPDQIRTVIAQLKSSELRLIVKKFDEIPTDQWMMDRGDLAHLANKAIETTCIACDGSCKNQCKLRRIVDDLPVDLMQVGITFMACKGNFDI